jgi:hypothetical protein
MNERLENAAVRLAPEWRAATSDADRDRVDQKIASFTAGSEEAAAWLTTAVKGSGAAVKTTPLTYTTEQPLDLPATAYNDNGIAVVVLAGSRYAGEWKVNACIGAGDDATVIGSLGTGKTTVTDAVVTASLAWIAGECERLGLKVVHTENDNHRYGPAERPYFTCARALVVDKDWV